MGTAQVRKVLGDPVKTETYECSSTTRPKLTCALWTYCASDRYGSVELLFQDKGDGLVLLVFEI